MQPDDRRLAARWTRREFVRGAAGMVALPHLPLGWLPRRRSSLPMWPPGRARCMSSGCAARSGQGYSACPAPRLPAFCLSPAQRTLYVANEVDVHEGLPRGTVEAFHVDPLDGQPDPVGPHTTVAFRNPPPASGPLTGWKAACRGRLRRRNLQPLSHCRRRQPGPTERHF